MPASTTIISSAKRSSVQFIPNSPIPPRGMISKTLDTYRCYSTLWTGLKSIARQLWRGRPPVAWDCCRCPAAQGVDEFGIAKLRLYNCQRLRPVWEKKRMFAYCIISIVGRQAAEDLRGNTKRSEVFALLSGNSVSAFPRSFYHVNNDR